MIKYLLIISLISPDSFNVNRSHEFESLLECERALFTLKLEVAHNTNQDVIVAAYCAPKGGE